MVRVVLIRQAKLARLDAATMAWFIVQPLQSFLHKSLHPPVDIWAVVPPQRHVGDVIPSARSKTSGHALARPAGMTVARCTPGASGVGQG